MAAYLKYTMEQFVSAVANNYNVRQVLTELGLKPAGGNYSFAKRRIKELSLDTSHWGTVKNRQGWAKGKKFPEKSKPIEHYLIEGNISIGSNKLKKRLFKENYFEKKCYKCNRTEWNDLPIRLELEHINGKHNDNRIRNLTILCPNCHAQTDTYRGKNKKS